MTAKYGAAGVANIYAALVRLIAADGTRRLTTAVVDIDDATQVAAFNTAPIINAADAAGVKRVVDAIDASVAPDYLVLLDGPDVIPHVALQPIPALVDGDQDIPSDLPYACAAPFGTDASDYLAVTRVVGRIPMPRGSSDANRFVELIDLCGRQAPRPASAYSPFFAISTEAWKVSTQLNLSAIFGSHASLNVSPTAGHAGIDPSLASLSHLINCHGATQDRRFYGQQGASKPIAMDSALVKPNIKEGTVAAVECCFGAELFDPAAVAGGDPMSMVYLSGGAAAYVGSTNRAYGPFSSNAQADLMVQFFLDAVFKGASTGRAMLQARQRFVNTQKMSAPTNLKTLAQFVLYADPSVVPIDNPQQASIVAMAGPGVAVDTAVTTAKELFSERATPDDARSARKARRVSLKSVGDAVASSATYLGGRARPVRAAKDRIQAIAKERGFSGAVSIFNVDGGPSFRRAAKALDRKEQVAVTCQIEERQDPDTGEKHSHVRVLVAYIMGDGIVAVDESVSR
jgi:hypothetical protein